MESLATLLDGSGGSPPARAANGVGGTGLVGPRSGVVAATLRSAAMAAVVLLAGILLLVYGVATLTAGGLASHDRGRPRASATGVAITVGGMGGVVGGLVWLTA